MPFSREGSPGAPCLKLCAGLAAGLALPAAEAATIARALAQDPRPRVLWLALQGCNGCTESATRAHEPTVESLILESLSLDYHTTLMAAAGDAAQVPSGEPVASRGAEPEARHDPLVSGKALGRKRPAWAAVAATNSGLPTYSQRQRPMSDATARAHGSGPGFAALRLFGLTRRR